MKLSPSGGWAGEKITATGFFHTAKRDGRWWLIDPAGHLFISTGLCSVNHGALDREKLVGAVEQWAIRTGAMLTGYGFNTLGCWSDWQDFRATPERMPYTRRWKPKRSAWFPA